MTSGTSTLLLFGKQKLGGGTFYTTDLLNLIPRADLQSPLAHQKKKRLKYREESLWKKCIFLRDLIFTLINDAEVYEVHKMRKMNNRVQPKFH